MTDDVDLAGALSDVPVALFLGDAMNPAVSDACFDHLTGDPSPTSHLVKVSYTETPARTVKRLHDRLGDETGALTVVTMGEAGDVPPDATLGASVTVEYVSATDLTGLGITIQQAVAEAEEADEDVAVCFDSLTPLLMYVDTPLVFRFMRTLNAYFGHAHAAVHYHLDPGAHDSQTVSVLTAAVDALVTVGEDGSVEVRHR